MKTIAAVIVLLLLWPATVHAQCTAPGCEEATAVVSAARATARAVLTREAPTVAPTQTPARPQSPPVFPQQQLPPPAQHYHTHNTIVIHLSRAGMSRFDECTEVATAMRVSRRAAERLIDAGDVKLIEPPAGR